MYVHVSSHKSTTSLPRRTQYLRGVDAVEQPQHLPQQASGLGGAGEGYPLRREGAGVRFEYQLEVLVVVFVSLEVVL